MTGNRKNPSVVVIGAGMTGIAAVIKLREAGITDIVLLEKKESVGGTWRENTYPGVACDVPSHAYTYSFAPNPEWSGLLSPGSEIKQYFEKVARDYKVDEVARFNEGVTSCSFDDNTQQWTVNTTKGNTYICDFLYSATGILHKPVTPNFKGKDSFQGEQWHSAEWNHDVDLKGKRVGIVGTGSSAVQFIPEVIKMPDTKVTVFQRTAQWIQKLENKPYTEKQKAKFRKNPKSMERLKNVVLWIFAKGTSSLTSQKFMDRIAHKLMALGSRKFLEKSIKDPVLRAKLTPDYTFGCKRVVMNSTFYEGIQKPNAHLETNGIDCIEPNGIRTKDGTLHELDVIIYGTGFDPVAYMRPMDFYGRDGLNIETAWEKKVQAYKSMCIPGFPNFFLLLGPNSPIGNYSVIAMSEAQIEYTLKLIDEWRANRIETIEATVEAQAEWRSMLKSKLSNTVWVSGCQSWYLDADGDPLCWPDTYKAWTKIMVEPDMTHFHTRSPTPAQGGDQQAA